MRERGAPMGSMDIGPSIRTGRGLCFVGMRAAVPPARGLNYGRRFSKVKEENRRRAVRFLGDQRDGEGIALSQRAELLVDSRASGRDAKQRDVSPAAQCSTLRSNKGWSGRTRAAKL